MPSYQDQLGNSILLSQPPKRIVSLVPSQTELLYHLGLEEEVAGITKFCVHPESWFRNKIRVGGTKDVKYERIKALQPDLILANKEENVKEQIEILQKDYPVWTSDIHHLDDALEMVLSIGALTQRNEKAAEIAQSIKENFENLSAELKHQPVFPALYLIWKDPYMAAGSDTFINHMMQYSGFQNIVNEARYPDINLEAFSHQAHLVVLLSSEPYPFSAKHMRAIQDALPLAKVVLADGEYFSWYGSRLMQAPAYFLQLRNEVLSLDHAPGTG